MPATTLGEAGKARASGGIKGGSVQTVNEYVGWQEGTQCSCNTVVKSLAWPAGYSCKQQSPVTGGDASEWERTEPWGRGCLTWTMEVEEEGTQDRESHVSMGAEAGKCGMLGI